MNTHHFLYLLLSGLLLVTSGCGCADTVVPLEIHGRTMGTTYTVKIVAPSNTLEAKYRDAVTSTLDRIDRLMSTYRDDSEVSRFNASESLDWFAVSDETAEVIELALSISQQTDGAFDITCAPLVALWGFGANKKENIIVDSVSEVKKRVGYQHLSVRRTQKQNTSAIRKAIPSLTIDLSAIAKGYAVDAVVAVLEREGVRAMMVEVGGEVACRGVRRDGAAWRIGIEEPRTLDEEQQVHTVWTLHNEAMATSGNYRDYRRRGDLVFSHIIDPRTGFPTELYTNNTNITANVERLGSVSVRHRRCAVADAWATALFVLGEAEAVRILSKHPELQVLLLLRNATPNAPLREVKIE